MISKSLLLSFTEPHDYDVVSDNLNSFRVC